jgi:hypothetical protein
VTPRPGNNAPLLGSRNSRARLYQILWEEQQAWLARMTLLWNKHMRPAPLPDYRFVLMLVNTRPAENIFKKNMEALIKRRGGFAITQEARRLVEDLNRQAAAANEANEWVARARMVDPAWFVAPTGLHGVGHTQRVHVHAQRLTQKLGCSDADTHLALTAALWHDIGRTGDGWTPDHGEQSVERIAELQLAATLAPTDLEIVLFAICNHSLPDDVGEKRARNLSDAERALRVLWLLKDADGLDRVRLGEWGAPDPAQLRSRAAAASIDFAWALLAAPI